MHTYIPSTSIMVKLDYTATAFATDGEAGHALLVRNLSTWPRSVNDMAAVFARAWLMHADLPSASVRVGFAFNVEVDLKATAGDAPACAHLLRACGFQGIDAHTPLAGYARSDTPLQAVSIFWVDRAGATRRLRAAAAGYSVLSVSGASGASGNNPERGSGFVEPPYRTELRFELLGADAAVAQCDLPRMDSTGFFAGFAPARMC